MTAVLLVGAQVGLSGVELPRLTSGADRIRELDPLVFERFATPAPPEAAPDTPDDEPVTEEVEPTPTAVSFDQEVGAAMEQLEELFAAEPATPVASERTDEAGSPTTPGINAERTDDRFESLFGGGADVAPVGRGTRRPGTSGGTGLGVGINERAATSEEPVERRPDTGPGVSVVTGTERAAGQGSEVAITEYASESFDGSEADRLATWMRTHPSPLPVGVQVHMNFEPTFLTSATEFAADGRNWELYLMFNESLRELHLVLVEGDRSVYLIDRGFQEQSRSLREGIVRRAGGQIVSVDSRSGIAGSDRAQDFYNVFLSWWESAQENGTP